MLLVRVSKQTTLWDYISIITNLCKPESELTLSERMCELSCKCTFNPLFRADNTQPLTNILNLPLKTHPSHCQDKWNAPCWDRLLPITAFVWNYLAKAGNRAILHVWGWWRCCGTLQEESKDYPVDYNLLLECQRCVDSSDWRSKRANERGKKKSCLHLKETQMVGRKWAVWSLHQTVTLC